MKCDDNNIKRAIILYVNGRLSPDEIEELWNLLVQNDEQLEYLKTVANLYSMGKRELVLPKID